MDNLSHSLRQNKLSRRSSQANAAAKGIYDDVFGGPPKFGVPATLSPRAEDYREIFGGFHAPRVSSIPVLDLPVVDEPEVLFDVRSPGFDYSEVFGGFKGLDFADGYEELFGQRRGGSAGSGSSDEAWTPAASESLSEESGHSGSNECFSNGDSHHSLDGNIEYNVSFHKANPRSDVESTNGLRRTAEIHAVPGYSYMVDETNPCQRKEKHLKKTRSDNSNGRNHRMHRKEGGTNISSGETFMTISEVNLRTEPSHLPPPSRPAPPTSTGDRSGTISIGKTGFVEENGGCSNSSSPPFFDVDVDASSSAAAMASAAAMKEAVMKAQAQLKSAKELMERKKEGRLNRARTVSGGELRDLGGKRANQSTIPGSGQGEGSEVKVFIREEGQDKIGTKSAVPDFMEGEKISIRAKQSAGKVRAKESSYSDVFGDFEEPGEWKEANQFFELVKADRSGAVLAQVDNEDLSENVRARDGVQIEGMIGRFEGQEFFHKMKATVQNGAPNEDCVADAKNVSSKAAMVAGISTHRKEPTIQDIGQRDGDKKMHRKTHGDREPVMKPTGSENSEDRESLNDVLIEVAREFEIRQVMERKEDGLNLKKSSRRQEANENVTKGHGKRCSEKERGPETVTESLGNEKRHPELSRKEEKENRLRMNLESAWEEANEREESEWRSKEALELEKDEKRIREALEQEKKLKEVREREENEKRLKANLELAENKRKQEAAARQEEERRFKEAFEKEENERRLREAREKAEKDKLKEALEREENEKKLRIAREQQEERMRTEAREKEEKERMLKEALKREENEKKLREAREEEERMRKASLEKEEKQRMLKEALEREETEMKMREACEQEERMRKEALEKEEKENMLREALQREENEKKLREACEQEERTRKEALEKEKILKEAHEREESAKRSNEALGRERSKKRMEESKMQENENRLGEACNRDEIEEERIGRTKRKEKCEDCHVNVSQDEDDRSYAKDSCTGKTYNDQEEIDDASKDTFELEELDKWLKEAIDVEESDILKEADMKDEERVQNDTKNIQPEFPGPGSVQVPGELKDAVDAFDDDRNQGRPKSQDSGNYVPAVDDKEDGATTEDSMESAPWVDLPEPTNMKTSNVSSHTSHGPRQHEENRGQERNEVKEHINKSEARFGDAAKLVETPQPAESIAQRTSWQSESASLAEGRVDNMNGAAKAQEKDTERLRREKEMENDQLRKIEEEREREREREKDRMGVDKATLEARERAYAEARERAERAAVERATAEARQRSLAEARERLEKACAEARERSSLEKTSMEARIRAERAAVERATAEARERAASRYNGMRQSNLSSELREPHHQAAIASSSMRYQYSSGNGASHNSEKSGGVEGESAQRSRARLERHRRTAERAAKALAEKNMRDLLAQREQAERHRLAETLDADVKRWSNGKEGNLRALLSTLQYILGSESGWQPIPLTDVITSAAVKKAYRKATLCVHPDKLQQRGASIQQKYICEKVFDLLKEAWNKFNSEER